MGRHRRGCDECNRSGKIICRTCRKSGVVRKHWQLVINFENSLEYSYKTVNVIPIDLLKQCQGKRVFMEKNKHV
jgi:hypothetical protein